MVQTNCSTLHMVYNIHQSATQGSNDTTHRLSRRTAGFFDKFQFKICFFFVHLKCKLRWLQNSGIEA